MSTSPVMLYLSTWLTTAFGMLLPETVFDSVLYYVSYFISPFNSSTYCTFYNHFGKNLQRFMKMLRGSPLVLGSLWRIVSLNVVSLLTWRLHSYQNLHSHEISQFIEGRRILASKLSYIHSVFLLSAGGFSFYFQLASTNHVPTIWKTEIKTFYIFYYFKVKFQFWRQWCC